MYRAKHKANKRPSLSADGPKIFGLGTLAIMGAIFSAGLIASPAIHAESNEIPTYDTNAELHELWKSATHDYATPVVEAPEKIIEEEPIYDETCDEASYDESSDDGDYYEDDSSYEEASGGGTLTKSGGVNYYNGREETWYSQRVLPGGGLDIPGRHVEESDGTVRDGDGNIVVASDNLPYGTEVETSLGPGKVYDTGVGHDGIDIYTDW